MFTRDHVERRYQQASDALARLQESMHLPDASLLERARTMRDPIYQEWARGKAFQMSRITRRAVRMMQACGGR